IASLAATPGLLAHLVAEAGDDALDATTPGAWSARTLLAHFRDDEYLCMRVALERILSENAPTLRFIEGAEWESGRRRSRDRKEWLLGDFALQRQASLAILRSLEPADWERTGETAANGSFTLAAFVAAWAGHDAEHIASLEAALGETVADVKQRRAHVDAP
ncbi:MAG: DinB family protein, partial [Tepidiformaceae bacterium]